MYRPLGATDALSVRAKDFIGGRNGERGEIASSTSGGRVNNPHSPKRSDKSALPLGVKTKGGKNDDDRVLKV